MDKDSFIVYIKTKDIYADIVKDVETRFDTSNSEISRPLTKGKNKKVIVSMHRCKNNERISEQKHSYLTDTMLGIKNESYKKVRHKRKLKFEGYKNCSELIQIENKINQSKKIKLE